MWPTWCTFICARQLLVPAGTTTTTTTPPRVCRATTYEDCPSPNAESRSSLYTHITTSQSTRRALHTLPRGGVTHVYFQRRPGADSSIGSGFIHHNCVIRRAAVHGGRRQGESGGWEERRKQDAKGRFCHATRAMNKKSVRLSQRRGTPRLWMTGISVG
jgi:hypothetical protein